MNVASEVFNNLIAYLELYVFVNESFSMIVVLMCIVEFAVEPKQFLLPE